MGEGMCQFMSSPKELSTLLKTRKLFIFLVFLIYIFNSILFVHSLTFSFAFAKFLVKLSFFKKLCNSKM